MIRLYTIHFTNCEMNCTQSNLHKCMILRSKGFMTELSDFLQIVKILIVYCDYYNGGIMQNRTLLDKYSGELFLVLISQMTSIRI